MTLNPNPLFVTTYDNGGAGIATVRLMDAIKEQGISANLLTYYKTQNRSDIQYALKYTSGFQKLSFRATMRYNRYHGAQYWEKFDHRTWSNNRLPNPIHQILNQSPENIIHLHWIGHGFVPISALPKIQKPIIWTLHDMWAFTGGCHVVENCEKYETHCGACPLYKSDKLQDLSYQNFEQKLKHWKSIPMTIVTPSQWLADSVRRSTLLGDQTILTIPNPIDTQIFQPLNQQFARQALGLPENKKLILFGAGYIHDENKGLQFLIKALHHLSDSNDIACVIFGDGKLDPTAFPVPVHHIGRVSDSRLLNLLYNSADVTVVPSQRETLPQVAVESVAGGTPVVCFATTGLMDVVDHQENGYLAKPFDTADLAQGIRWILTEADSKALAENARQKAEKTFSSDVVAKSYISIYEDVLKVSPQNGT